MDSHEFVAMAKKYAVDDVVTYVLRSLKHPKVTMHRQTASSDLVGQSIQKWIAEHSSAEQRRSEWFNRLATEDQGIVSEILAGCAENAVASFFTLLDGVGGPYDGVFELVAVDSGGRRKVLNPQNTGMLHDIFSEVCEEERRA